MDFSDHVASPQEHKEIVDMYVNAYKEDPIMHKAFCGTSTKTFFDVIIHHYATKERILFGKENGEVVAAIMWNDVSSNASSLMDIIRNNPFKSLRYLTQAFPFVLIRLIRWVKVLERNHYSEPHVYLYMMAAKGRGKGYGTTLMQQFLSDKAAPVYLENINKTGNSRFYTKCGFHKIGSYDFMGVEHERFLYTPE